VTVDASSLTTYTNFPDGAKATFRGPAPGSIATNGGSAGVKEPLAASNRCMSSLST
jgi:hypothetical protein